MSARSVILILVALAGPARAADAETRVFAVLVDGQPAGEYRLAVSTADDGTESVSCTAAVRVRHLLGGYRYSYRGTEEWKAGRVQRFDAASDDDGKKGRVHAAAEANGVRVAAGGSSVVTTPDVWPTTYWRLPAAGKPGPVTVLDADTGTVRAGRLEAVGPARLTVAGRPAEATRYRVVGPAPADVWYDARGRLVRQETVEDGHKTVLELREIQR